MRRYHGFRFFLLALSILISLNVAYLYHAYYEEVDLLVRKHFSDADEENLLTFIKKNPRVLHSPGLPIHHHVISLPEVLFFQPDSPLLQDLKTLVLRC
jgi:hypothetical protein